MTNNNVHGNHTETTNILIYSSKKKPIDTGQGMQDAKKVSFFFLKQYVEMGPRPPQRGVQGAQPPGKRKREIRGAAPPSGYILRYHPSRCNSVHMQLRYSWTV